MADDDKIVESLADLFQTEELLVRQAYESVAKNVRTIFRRQHRATVRPKPEKPLCKFLGLEQFCVALSLCPVDNRLLTLARVYDEAHIALCQAWAAKRKGRNHNRQFRSNPSIDVRPLTNALRLASMIVNSDINLQSDSSAITLNRIILQPASHNPACLEANWREILPMSFDELPELKSLSEMLPGEESHSQEYAGIGGGGGSDVISASLIGELLRRHKKNMNLLISTRTWATGSQGRNGSKIGVKREIFDHDGAAKTGERGREVEVAGTYRVNKNTYAEGRDLEAIPVSNHEQVFMVLDQTESLGDIPDDQQATLKDQFQAVLAQHPIETVVVANPSGLSKLRAESPHQRIAHNGIETVVSVDTGGDVFGAGNDGHATPDQDYRVQEAITRLDYKNLVTAVVAPGVDAPDDAPRKAKDARGMVYKLTSEDQQVILDLLKHYRMDGSDPNRFGKTTLALQARLQGIIGWTSLDLPEYVVDTWDNPWSSFVYIRDCMNEIIFMPTKRLLPIIKPRGH